MILTVHNLAKTYKVMPSEVMDRATTFDLYVLDVATRYIKYQQDIAEGRTVRSKNHNLSQEQMMNMIKRAREEDVGNKR